MSVIIQIPNEGAWQASGAGFRVLADEARTHLSPDDQKELARGQALGLVSLDKLDPQQAQRIAIALQRASTVVRPTLRRSDEDWEQSLSDALDDLVVRLTELAGTSDD